MIRIGETHAVIPLILDGYREHEIHGGPGSFIATEAVKRLVEAARMQAEYYPSSTIFGLLDALAPFTESDASLVDSGLRSCATQKDELVSVIERLLASVEAETDEAARAEEAARTPLQQIKGDQT